MTDARQGTSIEPRFVWHFFNAVTCTSIWFLAFVLSISIVAALPRGLGGSKVMFLVPLFLILVLNVGAMLFASIRASHKTMKVRRAENI